MTYTIEPTSDELKLIVKTDKSAFYQLTTIEGIERIYTISLNTYEILLFSVSDRGLVIKEINRILKNM